MAPGNRNSGQSAGLLAFAEPEAITVTGSSAWDAEAAALALADSVPCGVLLLEPDGELRAANAHLAEHLGLTTADLMALGSFDRLVDALAPRFADPAATAGRWRERRQAGQPCWDELKLVSPKLGQLERFGRPILDLQGHPAGWLEIYKDVTGQKLIEGNPFQIERMVTLGQLVSSVAHELSHPLTSILGYAQLLRRQRDGKQMDSATASILQEAERAGRMARSLLQFGRGAKPERGPVFLNEIVRGILALRTRELARERIRVDLELAPDLPPVLGDAGQLQQVLLNLLLNSEQAIRQVREQGTIRLRTCLAGTERVAVEVADDGPGIAPELLPRIFDPFFSTKPAGVGTGLGLSIAYGIAHDHGGTVSVESRPGGGATFTMELPAAPAPPLAARSLPREDVQSASSSVRRLDARARNERILVIEDEPAVAQLIADVLAEEGHHPETVLDSREGLARIGKKAYDLVICDLRMPHLSGRSLFQELQRRRHPLCRRFIFVTGDAFSPRTAHFLQAAGAPYLAKPFLIDELKDVLDRVLAQDEEKPLAAVRPGQKRQLAR